jgi:hypothetical protein
VKLSFWYAFSAVLFSFYWCRFHYCPCHHYCADDATGTTTTNWTKPNNEKNFHFVPCFFVVVSLHFFLAISALLVLVPLVIHQHSNENWKQKKKNCQNCLPTGDPLAAPAVSRLLPLGQLVPVHSRRHAFWRHWSNWFLLGKCHSHSKLPQCVSLCRSYYNR